MKYYSIQCFHHAFSGNIKAETEEEAMKFHKDHAEKNGTARTRMIEITKNFYEINEKFKLN
jgi:hypothetical protein